MLRETHMAVGVAATIAVTRPESVKGLILAAGVGAIGALISDIDVGTSESHKDADIITVMTSVIVLAVLALDYFLNTGIIIRVWGNAEIVRIIIGVLGFVAICAFGKEQPHRSFMHSLLALILLSGCLWMVVPSAVIYFAVGFLSHIIIDMLNRKRVRLLYPLDWGYCTGWFHAHGMANRILFSCGVGVTVVEVVLFAVNSIGIM